MKSIYFLIILLILFFFVGPIVLSITASLTPASEFYDSSVLIPSHFTLEHIKTLLFTLGGLKALNTSIQVALVAIAVSFLFGIPAGYALARYYFPGKDAIKLIMLFTRSIPLIVVSVALVTSYIRFNLVDTVLGVGLAHAAMILPFTVIITSSIFSSVYLDYEEAGMIFGLTRFGSFLRITLPLSLPGLAASAIYAFIMSWNEVFAASILSIHNRTLPAHILKTAMASPDYLKYAMATIMTIPALIFIFIIRKYLISIWGISLK